MKHPSSRSATRATVGFGQLPSPPSPRLVAQLYRSDPAQAHAQVTEFMDAQDRILDAEWQAGACDRYDGDAEAFMRDIGYTDAPRAILRKLIRRKQFANGDLTAHRRRWGQPQQTIARVEAVLSGQPAAPGRLRTKAPLRTRTRTRRQPTCRRRTSSSSRTSSSDPGSGEGEPARPQRLKLATTSRRANYTYAVLTRRERGEGI